MPTVYVKKESYDKIVSNGLDVQEFVNRAIELELKKVEKAT